MGTGGSNVRQLLKVTLLALIVLAGVPGTGKAANNPSPKVPESFRQLDARAISLKFYATDTPKGAPMASRAYTTDFIRSDTHYIWWELQLKAKAKRDKTVRLPIKVVWQRPNGTEFRQTHTVNIAPGLEHPCLAGGWGAAKTGGWLPGTYQITILIDEIPVAKGSFEVFEKLLKGH